MEDYATLAVRKRTRHEISLAQIVPIVCLLTGVAIIFLLPLTLQLIYLAVCAAQGVEAAMDGYLDFVGPLLSGNAALILGMALSFLLLAPGALIYGIMKRKKGVKLLGTAKAPFYAFVACFFAATAAGNVVGNITDAFITLLQGLGLNPAVPDFSPPDSITSDPFTVILYVVSVSVIPAFLEEFTFRGVYICDLKRRAPYAAMFLSGLAFSFAHGNLAQIPSAFVFGLIVAYFVIRFDCIWIGVVAHFLNNLISVLTLGAFSFWGGSEAAEAVILSVYNLAQTVIVVGGIAAAVLFLALNGFKLRDSGYGGYGGWASVGAVFKTPGFYIMLAAALIYFILNNIFA